MSLTADMARTVSLVPRLWLLFYSLLDTAFIVNNDVLLALLIVLFRLSNVGEWTAFELLSADFGERLVR